MGMSDWVSWVVVLHVVAATAWAGGAMFIAAVIGPVLQKFGPQSGGFMTGLATRGGFSRYFLGVGAVTILLGAILYGQEGIYKDPWSTVSGNLWLTLGAIIAVLAFLDGLFIIMPKDRKFGKMLLSLKGPPTAEQAADIAARGKEIGILSAISTLLVVIAIVMMMLRRLA